MHVFTKHLKNKVCWRYFANEADYDKIQEDDVINFLDLKEFAPGKQLTLEFVHADGTKDIIMTNHSYNEGQIGWFVAGSALNLIAAAGAENKA